MKGNSKDGSIYHVRNPILTSIAYFTQTESSLFLNLWSESNIFVVFKGVGLRVPSRFVTLGSDMMTCF